MKYFLDFFWNHFEMKRQIFHFVVIFHIHIEKAANYVSAKNGLQRFHPVEYLKCFLQTPNWFWNHFGFYFKIYP